MARGWRVLDATSLEGAVNARHGHLLLSGGDGTHEVPAADVAVLLIGNGVRIHPAVLNCASKYDIALLAADWRGIPYCGVFPWGEHTRVAARHIAQAELSLPRKKNAWMQLIKAKILGQAANLNLVDHHAGRKLVAMANSVRSGDPANYEGQAARYYWPRLFARGSFVRDQSVDYDENSLLNYGYMVLRGFGVRSVLSAGLAPPLGVFHHGRSNYFNLVDDLIEPFRPAVDAAVVAMPRGANLDDASVKQSLVAAVTQRFTPDGYRIPAVLDDLAQQFGRYVEGNIERLVVKAWQGPIPSTDPRDGEE